MRTTLCPMGCGCIETHQHYIQCKEITKSIESKKARVRVSQWMYRSLTEPTLQNMIDAWIDDYMNSRETRITEDTEMERIRKEQSIIG